MKASNVERLKNAADFIETARRLCSEVAAEEQAHYDSLTWLEQVKQVGVRAEENASNLRSYAQELSSLVADIVKIANRG